MAKNTGRGSVAGSRKPSRFIEAKTVGGSFGKVNPYKRPGWFARFFLGRA